ncbi:MAG: hypothetical protein R3B47_12030 [Bacteroidia bacterium]
MWAKNSHSPRAGSPAELQIAIASERGARTSKAAILLTSEAERMRLSGLYRSE